MGEPYLTWAEIEKKYDQQWVLVADPKHDRHERLLGGRVVFHLADRAEFLRRLVDVPVEVSGPMSAVRYAGKFPEEEDEIIPAEPELARQ